MRHLLSSLLVAALCVIGAALAFFENPTTPKGILTLAVTALALLLLVFGAVFPFRLPKGKSFAASLPALGPLWFLVNGYALTAVALLLAAKGFDWSFASSLLAQAVLLVLSLAFLIVAPGLALRHAAGVQRKEALGIVSLDELRLHFERGCIACAPRLADTPEIAMRLRAIGEDLRCIASSSTEEAQALERELLRSLPSVFELCAGEGRLPEAVQALDHFAALVQKRRTCRVSNDHKESFS